MQCVILTSLVVNGEVGFSQRHRRDLSVARRRPSLSVDAGGLGGDFMAVWRGSKVRDLLMLTFGLLTKHIPAYALDSEQFLMQKNPTKRKFVAHALMKQLVWVLCQRSFIPHSSKLKFKNTKYKHSLKQKVKKCMLIYLKIRKILF